MDETLETIVRVAGEGGGYTIVGIPDENAVWKLRSLTADGTPALVGGQSIHRKGGWVGTLAEALADINPSWFRLHPLEVHPQFRVAVLAEVASGMLALRERDGSLSSRDMRILAAWQEMCGSSQRAHRSD
jgi:hypothetical protein